MKNLRICLLIAALGVALLGLACSESESDLLTSPEQGMLTVNIHDQACSDIEEALVTFESVQAVAADSSVVDVQGVTLGEPIDLVELVSGKQITLASGALRAGDYIALNLEISAITIKFKGATPVPLPTGSGLLVSISVNFTVVEGEETVITIDFPPCAIQLNGQSWMIDTGAITAG